MKKAIFNKATETYPHGSLREQPEGLDRADTNNFADNKGSGIVGLAKPRDFGRTIPCSANNWKDGQELEEGKDYDVEKQFLDDNDVWQSLKELPSAYDSFKYEYRRLVAVPIVQETEDELWNEVKQTMRNHIVGIHANAIQELKSKFTIKRKQWHRK